jgi:hypothetical protein
MPQGSVFLCPKEMMRRRILLANTAQTVGSGHGPVRQYRVHAGNRLYRLVIATSRKSTFACGSRSGRRLFRCYARPALQIIAPVQPVGCSLLKII